MANLCPKCKNELAPYHTGYYCNECQEKQLQKMIEDREDLVDAEGYAKILGLDNAEQVRRLARDGVLAPRVPHVRRCLWRKKDIEEWFKQEQRKGDVFRRIAQGIASNLRRCSNDNIIRAISDTPGKKAYGQEYVLGTAEAGRVEPIQLVKVPIATAKRMLQQLPKKDFPELKGITDWGKLPYDRIHEAFLVRLETYF